MADIAKDTSILGTAPNREYLELTFVKETATVKGINTKIIMSASAENPDTFEVTEGRIGIKIGRNRPRKYSLLMSEWDNFYQQKQAKGWMLTNTKKPDVKKIERKGFSFDGGMYDKTGDMSVDTIITKLLSYANRMVEESYTTKIEDVSDEMINLATSIFKELSENHEKMSIPEFNNKLKILYAAIPRRINKLSDQLAKRTIEFTDIIAREQELFEVLLSQIRGQQNLAQFTKMPTVLEAFNLEWREVSEDEKAQIQKMLGGNARQYKNAWRIVNKKTEAAFDTFCKKENLKEGRGGISHLFHGSRSENFWSIITTGLNINPIGVVITGKMFGNGSYFAPKAQKSIGYTSSYGSVWAKGSESVGYLGIFKVATGKEYHPTGSDSSLTWAKLQKVAPGCHCTWAQSADTSLRNDEVIVYQNQQSTIEYLVEFSV